MSHPGSPLELTDAQTRCLAEHTRFDSFRTTGWQTGEEGSTRGRHVSP